MVLNEKQRQIGKDNFGDAAKISRRQVLTGALAIPTAASIYWGYDKLKGNPVRTGLDDKVCYHFCRDGHARLILSVLACIAEIGNDSRYAMR